MGKPSDRPVLHLKAQTPPQAETSEQVFIDAAKAAEERAQVRAAAAAEERAALEAHKRTFAEQEHAAGSYKDVPAVLEEAASRSDPQTREALLDQIRQMRAATVRPVIVPAGPTPRQQSQTELEQEAGRKRVAYYAQQGRPTPEPAPDTTPVQRHNPLSSEEFPVDKNRTARSI